MTQRAEKAWIYSFLLAVTVVLLCLITGEIALREWFPLDNVVLQPDSRYLYKFIPNSRQLVRPLTASGAPTVLVKINSQGRRGELITEDRKYRIMVYGDSFIVAEGTPLKQTFASRLEELLGARLRQRVSVINAGVPGYGPDQASLVMEDEIDRIRPRLIVFSIYSGNDFGDLVRNKLFGLDGQGHLVVNHPALDPAVRQGFESAYRQQPRFQLIRRVKTMLTKVWKPTASDPYADHPGALVKAWVAQAQTEYANYVVENDNQVHNLFADGYDVDISTAPQSDSARYKTVLMTRVLERVHAIAASRSIPVIFLIIPSPIDVLDTWDVSIDSHEYPAYNRRALTGTLEEIVKSRGYAYLNLFEPFQKHQHENFYYRGLDDHWNANGQQFAADLMTDYILKNEAVWTLFKR